MLNRSNLHDYQNEGIDFIKGTPKSALWWMMGFGKTATALTAVSDLYNDFEMENALIIAPMRVCRNVWPRALTKWQQAENLNLRQMSGSEGDLRRVLSKVDFEPRKANVHAINRENVVWLADVWGQDWPYDMVVIDESSSFKAHGSQRNKALRKVYSKIDRMVQLTGTPAPNGYHDLWAQIALLDNGERLGRTVTKFRQDYFRKSYNGFSWEIREGSKELIDAKLQDIVLVKTSGETKAVINPIWVGMGPVLKAKYKEFEKEFLVEMRDETITAVNAAVLVGKLQQFANGAVYVGGEDGERKTLDIHKLKLDALQEIMDSANGKPVLVGYNFKSDLERIKKHFARHFKSGKAVVLDADPKTEDRWNAGEIGMLLAHPASAGHGLNLQGGGHIMALFGLNWSLELYQQFIKRLDRQGQEAETVFIHQILLEGSVDETMVTTLERKDVTQAGLLKALTRDAKRRVR